MQDENATTYQISYQWPSSMPKSNIKGVDRPKSAPQKNLVKKFGEFAQAYPCNSSKTSTGGQSKTKSPKQGNCVHVNVFMPYQVNFNNVPVDKKKDLNAYIYNSERKEALQSAAMKCTAHPPPTMTDINKKVDIRPKTSSQNPQSCLTMEELKSLVKNYQSKSSPKKSEK